MPMTKYKCIEDKLQPIIELLEKNNNEPGLKEVYKGITTLMSPLIEQPDILFLGINPGPGHWREKNDKSSLSNITPLRKLGEDEVFIRGKIDWFKSNTARGYWGDDKKKTRMAYEWYQRDKPINNIFPATMIDLLYLVAEKKYPESTSHTEAPKWETSFGKKIMYTNIYPIVTENVKDLDVIFKYLLDAKVIAGATKKWDVQLFFIGLIYEIIDLVKPKIIVCMGKQALNDLTYKTNGKRDVIATSITIGKKSYPTLGFSRKYGWSKNIKQISDEIIKNI